MTSDLGLLQVNETLLRSIVTQPSSEHYVYAYNFTALPEARNALVGSTCENYVPDSTTTTRTRPSPSRPQTTTTPVISTPTRFFNGILLRHVFVLCICLHSSNVYRL